VLTSTRGVWIPVDATAIAWSSVTAKGFPYRFRQKSGPWNALGAVKFMFPNNYNVYIHGNAEQGLFDQRLRMFSHGCVRIDKPLKLARWALNHPDWTTKRLKAYMNQPKPVEVPVGEPIPVYLLYFTAWVDDDQRLNFRQDIYGRDNEMQERFYRGGKIVKD
jgi:L,D-transpeptidase YcbB